MCISVDSEKNLGGSFEEMFSCESLNTCEEVMEWGGKGKSLKIMLCKLALGAVLYHIFRQRNDINYKACQYGENRGANS
jgi:hypothetical protein